ncbi:MAG TPA: helix-turn-helix domain-containing protein [Vicinamibacterales bacterium]|nr:helix-turn-helix domain-containing protein [Vicinamibacterales bacterium]
MKRLKKKRRGPRRDSDTERAILDAAHAVFVRRGTAGARMQEIAKEAGVNQALLHYYFRSKEALARAAFERAATQLMPAVIQVVASERPLEEKVEEVIALELEHLSRAPYLPGYIIGEVTHHPERARQLIAAMTHGLTPDDIRPRMFGPLSRQIAERVAAGRMRPIAADSFMVNLMSLCIFPFAGQHMLQAMLGLDADGFRQFIARRRDELPQFFLGALRP